MSRTCCKGCKEWMEKKNEEAFKFWEGLIRRGGYLHSFSLEEDKNIVRTVSGIINFLDKNGFILAHETDKEMIFKLKGLTFSSTEHYYCGGKCGRTN